MANILLQVQKNNIDPVDNNNNIVFDETVVTEGNISYSDLSGVVTIEEEGLYLVDWYVVTQSAPGVTSVSFNPVTGDGQVFESNMPTKTGIMSGLAIINVAVLPFTIQLVNQSNTTVYFSNAVGAKANLRIVRLDHLIPDNSRCFAMDQLSFVMKQLADAYSGENIRIFTNIFGVIDNTLYGYYQAPDTSSSPLLLISDPLNALNLNHLVALYFFNVPYDESITFLQPPDPFPQNCDTDLIKNIHDFLSVGDNISFLAGPNISGSGDIIKNEYGLLVLGDDTSSLYLPTPNLTVISIESNGEDFAGRSSKGHRPLIIETK
ncbi:MAG TPA: hypothetical protein PKO20_07025 [Clostridiales bacterium]|nr:hypothetical protein [Clostridiales bacterium]